MHRCSTCGSVFYSADKFLKHKREEEERSDSHENDDKSMSAGSEDEGTDSASSEPEEEEEEEQGRRSAWDFVINKLYEDKDNRRIYVAELQKSLAAGLNRQAAEEEAWHKLLNRLLGVTRERLQSIIETVEALKVDELYSSIMQRYEEKLEEGDENAAVAFDYAWNKNKSAIKRELFINRKDDILEGVLGSDDA